MARFRRRTCDEEGTFVCDGRYACPRCGSSDVQFAVGNCASRHHGDEATASRAAGAPSNRHRAI